EATRAGAVHARQQRLVDGDLRYRIREDVVQIRGTGDATHRGIGAAHRQVQTIQLHRVHVRLEAADDDVRAVAGGVVAHERDAGDAPQRFRDRGAREVTQRIRGNHFRVVLGGALLVERQRSRATASEYGDLGQSCRLFEWIVRSP